MKTLKCEDISGTACSYEAKGETDQEVIDDMMRHAAETHREMAENASEQDKQAMISMMKAKLQHHS
jgi:predicted small metal-binding protein